MELGQRCDEPLLAMVGRSPAGTPASTYYLTVTFEENGYQHGFAGGIPRPKATVDEFRTAPNVITPSKTE